MKVRAIIAMLSAVFAATGAMAEEEQANFHHVHINAMDPAKSVEFYRKFWGGVAVKYAGKTDVVLTDRSFIFFNKVATPAASELRSAIYHIGWGGVDGPSEYEWRKKEGMQFETPGTPLIGQYYMYIFGPDREVIEIWTAFHHNRFGHVHLFADDVNVTARWYRQHLGLDGVDKDVPKPKAAPADYVVKPSDASIFQYLWMNAVKVDDVELNIFGKPDKEYGIWWNYEPIETLEPTKGRVVDHLAFSYKDIKPVFERMKAAGVEIVEPITFKEEYQFNSFFVMGPDKVTIEIVEAKPLPEGIWE